MAKTTPDHHDAERQLSGPVVFRNAEWVARECPDGAPVFERIKARLAKLAAARG